MTKSRRVSSCTQINNFLASAYKTCVNFSSLTDLYYRGIPHLRGNFLLGRLSQVGNELGEEMKRAGELAILHPSGMCYEYIGPTNILLLITKPEHIHQVMQFDRKGEVISKARVLQAFGHVFGNNLFFVEGDEWVKQRRIYNHYFLKRNALRDLKPNMQIAIDSHIEKMMEEKHDSYTVELNQFCTDLAMIVIATTRMGTQILERHALGKLQKSIANAMREVSDYRNSVRIMVNDKLPCSLSSPTAKARNELHNEFIKYIINNSHSSRILETDNLLRTISAEAANKASDEMKVEDLKSKRALCDGSFILLAGHETTSKLIQFIVQELSRHPKIVEKIREELSNVDISILSSDDLKIKLPFLNNVINEALRLYPPVPAFAREVMQDFMIGDIPIQKGMVIVISPLVTHLREDVAGPHPTEFNPDRWNKELNPNLYARGAFTPFGSGARMCVGERFAILEATLAVATLVKHFNFELKTSPNEDPQIFFETRFEGTLKPIREVMMTFIPR